MILLLLTDKGREVKRRESDIKPSWGAGGYLKGKFLFIDIASGDYSRKPAWREDHGRTLCSALWTITILVESLCSVYFDKSV